MTDKNIDLPGITPFPELKLGEIFEGLSEPERMFQGYPYRPLQPVFRQTRRMARELTKELNGTRFLEGMEETRRNILDKLLHPSCLDKKNIVMEPPFRCSRGESIKVGENFRAEAGCVIVDKAMVTIGKDCWFGPGVHIYSATHPLDAGYRLQDDLQNYFDLAKPITIGDRCRLQGRVIICPGVTLGNNVVVEVGAVVTKSFVEDSIILSGNPARITGHYCEQTK